VIDPVTAKYGRTLDARGFPPRSRKLTVDDLILDTSVEPPPRWAVYWSAREQRWLVERVRVTEEGTFDDYVKAQPLSGGDSFLIFEDDVFKDLQEAQRYAAMLALRDT
jgi:hypothetical protein